MRDSTWCVYRRELIPWRYSGKQGEDGREELKKLLASLGLEGDSRVHLVYSEAIRRWCLQLLAPVLKAEWGSREDADAQLKELGPEAVIARSGSAEEAVLIAEGKELKGKFR